MMDFKHPLAVVTPTLDGDVLSVLARANEEFSGRRLHALVARGSENGIRKAAERLVDQGIVSSRPAGRANLYRLNRSHLAAPHIEGLALLRTQLLERAQELVSAWTVPPRLIMVFGSVARGEAGPLSDVDLLVIRPTQIAEDLNEWREQLNLLEKEATAWTGNDARVLEYGEGDLQDEAVRGVIEEAIEEGIELYGSRRTLLRLIRENDSR
jgi:predicted nucleotidyltransferase